MTWGTFWKLALLLTVFMPIGFILAWQADAVITYVVEAKLYGLDEPVIEWGDVR